MYCIHLPIMWVYHGPEQQRLRRREEIKMPVKVITSKNKELPDKFQSAQDRLKISRIIPAHKNNTENIIIRVIKVMLMDVRLRFDKKYREDYNDYAGFCDLARGKH